MNISQEDRWIGERLIKAGVLTKEERDHVLEVQAEPINKHIRFGDLAVREGYCEEGEIESIGGFLGEMLVEAGLLNSEQLKTLLDLQKSMRESGLFAPNIGELAAVREFCDKQEIEDFILFSRRTSRGVSSEMPGESSDW